MFSVSAILRAPFRLLTTPSLSSDAYPALALGRSHASWFLVYATRPFIEPKRVLMCLNFIVPGDPHTVGARSPSGNPIFTVGGCIGAAAMEALSGLQDEQGFSPIDFTKEYSWTKNPYQLFADVEVLLPESDIMKACAHCGKWETYHGPRFLRCSGCQSRHYCSVECQEDDWKPQYHQGECGLLAAGKEYEAESRRKLHNNGWWFDYGDTGDQALLADKGFHTHDRAIREIDVEQLAYGRRYPPHDVSSPPRRAPPAPRDDDYPPGFVPTGSEDNDSFLRMRHRMTVHGRPEHQVMPSWMFPEPDSIPLHAIPPLPPLPETPGFEPTGDPLLDERLLHAYLRDNGSEAQRKELVRVVRARWKSMKARQRIADERQARTDKMLRSMRAASGESDPDGVD